MNDREERERIRRELEQSMRPVVKGLTVAVILALLAAGALVLYFLHLGGGIWR